MFRKMINSSQWLHQIVRQTGFCNDSEILKLHPIKSTCCKLDHLIKEMGRKSFSKFASLQIFVFVLQSSFIGKSSGRQINSYSTGTNGWLLVEIKISNMQTCETQKDLLRKSKRRSPEYRDVLHQLRKSHLGGLWSGCRSLRICLDIEHLRWTFIEMSTLHYCPV